MTSNIKDNTAKLAQQIQPVKMINRPTVVPTSGVEQPTMNVIGTDPYFSLTVDTSEMSEPTEIILFDGSQGYQFGFNASMPLGVKIAGRTADYQYILNDIVHNSSFLDTIRLQVINCSNNQVNDGCSSNDIAMVQFANAVDIYESSKGARPKRVGTFYPDMGIHEGQFQLNISTFKYNLVITNRTALVYRQEPGVKVIWSFYQKAEIGRHQ
ncbi:MAG TPA: hypothetical protein VJ953_18505 [Saprospiraceae bacterium]|nr:hypothetical protein [Saprospiraceae bacterium]